MIDPECVPEEFRKSVDEIELESAMEEGREREQELTEEYENLYREMNRYG